MSSFVLLLIKFGMFLDYYSCAAAKKPVQMPSELVGAVFEAVQKCQPETGVGADTLIFIYDGKYREDQQFKNFIYCSYKTAGFLLNDGHINEDKAIKMFKNEPLVEEGVRRCGQEKGENAKESLFLFYKCFVDTTPVRFVI